MKDFFKPEDFNPCIGLPVGEANKLAAEICNSKLATLVESWPVIYGRWNGVHRNFGESLADKHNPENHKIARLAFIEEIKKEPCKHRWMTYDPKDGPWTIYGTCGTCGVKMEKVWKAVE